MRIIRKYFWYLPAVIWMFVIFSFSGQTAEVSSGISLKVTQKIVQLIGILRGGENVDPDYLVELLHPYVRKCAHMGEFGVLFVLLFLSFLASTVATRAMAAAIFVFFIYACLDEFHQTKVGGRAGAFTDVCVDMTGVLAAVMFVLMIYSFWQVGHERKMEMRIAAGRRAGRNAREEAGSRRTGGRT